MNRKRQSGPIRWLSTFVAVGGSVAICRSWIGFVSRNLQRNTHNYGVAYSSGTLDVVSYENGCVNGSMNGIALSVHVYLQNRLNEFTCGRNLFGSN